MEKKKSLPDSVTLSQWKTLQRVFISAGIKPDSSCRRQDPAWPGLASLQLALRFHSGNMDLLSATHQAPLCSPNSAFAVPGLWHGSSWLQVAGLLLFILISAPRFLLEVKRLPQNLTDAHPPASHSLRVTGLLSFRAFILFVRLHLPWPSECHKLESRSP